MPACLLPPGLGLAIVLLLSAPLAAAAEPDDGNAFEARVRDYLLAHPEVVVEALERYRLGRRELVRAVTSNPVVARASSLFENEDDPWLGNPEADVTLVAFVDYNTDSCRRMAPVLERLLERDPGLRIAFKPLAQPGDGSYFAALATLAALGQGRFAALHEALMNVPGALEEADVFRVAAHVGLDLDRLRRDMGVPTLGAALRRTERLARELGIDGAPAFAAGTEIARGAQDLEALEFLIARARLP